jgi:hypothetical protein
LTKKKEKTVLIFCYVCKRHFKMTRTDFGKCGHINNRVDLMSRYKISTNKLERDYVIPYRPPPSVHKRERGKVVRSRQG